jgi:hypothetical protein
MPKKRHSEGKGKIIPTDMPERHQWKCPVKGCRAKGKAATKADAALALILHHAMTH